MEDSRKRTRVSGHFQGRLETHTSSWTITTENISLKGLLCDLQQEAQLQAGEAVTVVLPLADDVLLSIEGTVVRQRDRQVAVDFEGMDEESYAHLRNIVRFAANDPDAIDKEQAHTPFLDEP